MHSESLSYVEQRFTFLTNNLDLKFVGGVGTRERECHALMVYIYIYKKKEIEKKEKFELYIENYYTYTIDETLICTPNITYLSINSNQLHLPSNILYTHFHTHSHSHFYKGCTIHIYNEQHFVNYIYKEKQIKIGRGMGGHQVGRATFKKNLNASK